MNFSLENHFLGLAAVDVLRGIFSGFDAVFLVGFGVAHHLDEIFQRRNSGANYLFRGAYPTLSL